VTGTRSNQTNATLPTSVPDKPQRILTLSAPRKTQTPKTTTLFPMRTWL